METTIIDKQSGINIKFRITRIMLLKRKKLVGPDKVG